MYRNSVDIFLVQFRPLKALPLLSLQRHFRVLTKFAHVESRLSGHKRQREVVFYAPVNLCARRACSTSVAVGISTVRHLRYSSRRWHGCRTGLAWACGTSSMLHHCSLLSN